MEGGKGGVRTNKEKRIWSDKQRKKKGMYTC